MAAHLHIKVTAAADIRQEALDRFASEFGGETFLSVEDLCRSPHVDIVRAIGGGLVRTVRGVTSAVDPARPVEGSYLGFLTFDNRAAATITFNGYGYFNSHELTWDLGEERKPEAPDRHARAHQRMREFNSQEQEWELKNSLRYGGERSGQWASVGHYRPGGDQDLHQPFFGFTIVTCEKSDIRQSPDGLYVYTSEGTEEIPVERAGNPRWHEMDELYSA